jgi:hypothetical protein
MNKNLASGVRAMFVAAASVLATSGAVAQDAVLPADPAAVSEDGTYYRPVSERTPPVRLSVQKAQARGAQRMARLEAMRWYGFSNSRPTAAAIPWTTMYSPAWQTPGGRPFAWYPSTRPVVVINHAYPVPVYR